MNDCEGFNYDVVKLDGSDPFASIVFGFVAFPHLSTASKLTRQIKVVFLDYIP